MSAAAVTNLLPPHFALSEALVAVAGVYAIVRALPMSKWFALGLVPVALAGLVGAIRIGAGMTGPIVELHQFLSRPGALFGLGLMVGILLGRGAWLPPALGVAAAAVVILAPAANPVVFLALILSGAVLAYRVALNRKALAAVSFAFLLIAIAASAPFGKTQPAFAWHLFHVLAALWFILVAAFVPMSGPRQRS